MVSRLTTNLVCFFKPLLLKTLRFSILAYRTISLFLYCTVYLVKSVPILACSPSFIDCSKGIRVNQRVFCLRNKSQMVNFNTTSVFANVVNYHSLWNVTILKEIRNSVRPSILFLKEKLTVSIVITITRPYFALATLNDKLIKSGRFLLCKSFHVDKYTPCNTNHKYV